MSGSKCFSVFDLRSRYYEMPMSGDNKLKMALIWPPENFHRLMEQTLQDINFLEVLLYLDDLIVFGRTTEAHGARLLNVLNCHKEEGLNLLLDKCPFSQTSITYVRHTVSQDGIVTASILKTEVIKDSVWPRPLTVTVH